MLGKRSAQQGMFEADTLYGEFVGRRTFYGYLASQRYELFRDADFATLYCENNGRPSVPPSLLATALVLQTYDGVSDDEATRRAAFDLQWKVALGVEVNVRPFAKSTLQEFRAQLIVHDKTRAIFQRSLELAKRRGMWKKGQAPQERQHIKVALDTTNILGRGAVKDSYNMLADGIVQVLRALATLGPYELLELAEELGCTRYVSGSSLKGQAEVDWSDAKAREQFLAEIVADADRLLELVRGTRGRLVPDSDEDKELVAAAEVLARILAQDARQQFSRGHQFLVLRGVPGQVGPRSAHQVQQLLRIRNDLRQEALACGRVRPIDVRLTFETRPLDIASTAHFLGQFHQLARRQLGQCAKYPDDAIRQQVVRVFDGPAAEDVRRIQRQFDVLPFMRRMALLPHSAAFGDLQTALENGTGLIVQDQLRSEFLQRALGERTRLQFDAQRHLPPQVVVGALFGFVIRDTVIGLQHQRCRQQAGRHTRTTVVATIQCGEVLVSEQLVPLACQVAIKAPLTNELRKHAVRLEQSSLRRPLPQHARPFASLKALPPLRYPKSTACRKPLTPFRPRS